MPPLAGSEKNLFAAGPPPVTHTATARFPTMSAFDSELDQLRARSLFRRLREFDSPAGTEVSLGGKRLLNFASNDYLGFAADPVLREAAKAAIDKYGVGSGASRLICGTLSPHARLEEALADFKRTEAALTFSSGYAAAVGTLGALCGRDDVIILDKLAHASLIDGAKLSGAVLRIFPHNHLGKLESHLRWARENYPDARILVVTESVFSMDGDWCPLAEIVALKNRFGALLLLDEAHALGVIGDHGRGLADHLGLAGKVDIHLGTLSKALGCSGGTICGTRALIDLLINRARAFIYSTAPPPALAATARAAIELLLSPTGEMRRQRLRQNLAQFAEGMPQLFDAERKIQSAIIPVMLGPADAALEAARRLADAGCFVPAIRYPTVPKDAARLRVTLSARHLPDQISALCKAVAHVVST
ncbi:MAG: 8-amino-7-oxononanoate synthase [Chthoniobacteraceae bacterium]